VWVLTVNTGSFLRGDTIINGIACPLICSQPYPCVGAHNCHVIYLVPYLAASFCRAHVAAPYSV